MNKKNIKNIIIFIFLNFLTIYTLYAQSHMDYIELNNGDRVKCKSLTIDEFNELLIQHKFNHIKNYNGIKSIDVFISNKSWVLVRENDYYTLYFSLDDLDLVLNQELDTNNLGKEVLYNKNIYGENFPQHCTELIEELLISLNMNMNLKVDLDLLKKVEAKIALSEDPDLFKRDHFLNLIALLGLILNYEYGSRWCMILSSDKVTWNPYIDYNNHKIQFFTYLYEDVYLNNEDYENEITEIYFTVKSIIDRI